MRIMSQSSHARSSSFALNIAVAPSAFELALCGTIRG